MIDTTHDLTSHDEMLHKTGAALRVLLADQQTQQGSCDALREIARRQEEDLAEHQQRRASLLEALRTAQLASNKAQAARDLAAGGKTAKKREAEYTQAVSAVGAIQHELLVLSQADAKLREEQAGTQSVLQDAQENLARIVERVSIAQSIHDEELTAHREEIKAAWLEKLALARQERDKLKSQIVDAELTVQQVQAGMVEALRSWPQWAEEVLQQHLEIEPDLSSKMLDLYLHYSSEIEQHSQGLVRSDPQALKALLVPCPVHTFSATGTRTDQIAHSKANYRVPGRGISPDLWHFDTHLSETEQLRDRRRAERRQQVIHELVWGNQ